jgi:ectoine hydroxylase-related dioxygenase (phytanoyl-CoA dioxygenase family)
MRNRDYGLDGQPVSQLFAQPTTAEEWQQYALSAEQVRHFRDNGYLAGIQILDADQVDVLRDELQQLATPTNPGNEFFYEYHSNESENPNTVLFHALGAWRVAPGFHDILWAPAYRMAAYQLLGCGFRLFHDQLFSKPAKHGGVVAWHQDFSYWTWTSPMRHLTTWIALDDASTENGCMYYVPKSHHWGLLEKTGLAGDMDSVRQVLTDAQIADFDKKTPVELPLGYASFHHPLLMHGSYENHSERSRRATIINVFADGVVSNQETSTDPAFGSYPQVPTGEKMVGTYYPLLFDSAAVPGLDVPTIETV